MKKKVIIGALTAVVLVGGILAGRALLGSKGNGQEVKTADVKVGDVEAYLSTTATIESKNVKEYYGLQLKVNKVNVKVGDSIKKGAVMMEYDVSDLANAVKQAQINYNNALLQKKTLTQSNDAINKQIAEYKAYLKNNPVIENPTSAADIQKMVERNSIQTALANLKPIGDEQFQQADNAISLAKLALDSAKEKEASGQGTVTADFDGVVTTVNAVEGGVANPTQPAIELMDLNNLEAVVSAGKYDAQKIQIGQPAEIKVQNEMLKGKVSFIDPVARKASALTGGGDTTLQVKIDILDKSSKLKVDFDTDVNILIGEAKNALKIPAEAIRSDKYGRNYVYIVVGNKAVEKTVRLGVQSDMEAQVLDGVKKGDKVILNPSESIKNGTTVQVTNEVDK